MSYEVKFCKLSAGGNDFIVIDHRQGGLPEDLALWIKHLCCRRLSVGADGVILLEGSTRADFRMRYFNADGSEAPLCGNGVRAIARYASLMKIAPPKMTIETGAGLVPAEVKGGRVRTLLPPPLKVELHFPITLGEETIEGSYINVGVPFFVQRVEELDGLPVRERGREIRYHPDFQPEGTNACFVNVLNRNRIAVRIYERGVEDETLSSGTGCLSASLTATLLGAASPPITCHTRSGIDIGVDFQYKEGKVSSISVEGDARIIYYGELHEDAYHGFSPPSFRD